VKCFAWKFDRSKFVRSGDKKEELKRVRLENGDIIPDVESYFYFDE
jgi:hypothetical protein